MTRIKNEKIRSIRHIRVRFKVLSATDLTPDGYEIFEKVILECFSW